VISAISSKSWSRWTTVRPASSAVAATMRPATDGAAGHTAGGRAAPHCRERDVLRLLAAGMSNAEIRRELSIGDVTVKTDVTRLLQKLQVRHSVQAIVLADRCGFVER
jgi:DNA-binding NarL/FixJ family response regulator